MRLTLALGALAAATQAAHAAHDLPSWVGPLIVALASGGYLRYYTARQDKRLKAALADTQEQAVKTASVDRQETLDRIQRDVLSDWQARLTEMRVELAQAETDRAQMRTELEQAKTEMAHKDAKIMVLQGRIESLHDQVLALEQGQQAHKRRSDAPSRPKQS